MSTTLVRTARRKLVLGWALSSVGSLSACSSPDEEQQISSIHRNIAKDDSAEIPPLTWIDPKGRVWLRADVPARMATPEEEREHFAALQLPELVESNERPTQGSEPSFADMTVEEIAQALRGVTLRDGFEYVQEPDYVGAQALKDGSQAVRSIEPFVGTVKSEAGELLPAGEELIGQAVIGSDTRQVFRNNTTYPPTTTIMLTGFGAVVGGCTATLVGASTAVSAAHCFRTSSGAWMSSRGWAPAVDDRDANQYSWDPTSGAAYPHATGRKIDGCYHVATPAGYNNSVKTDYAVMEFDLSWGGTVSCGEASNPAYDDHPGNTLGWLGLAARSATVIYNNILSGVGYPIENIPGNDCPGGSCFVPSIWGASSLATEVNDHAVEYTLDMTGGQSGAGMYLNESTGRYVISIHRGYDCTAPFCTNERNYGRRVTSDVLSGILGWSNL